MTQGHKRGARFSNAFKAKVLARLEAGETQKQIADDLKMSDKSINNWVLLFRQGKLDLNGNSVTPEGEPRTHATRYGKKQPRKGKKLAAAAAEAPASARTARPDKQRVARLELELAFIKRDKAAFDKALKTLGI